MRLQSGNLRRCASRGCSGGIGRAGCNAARLERRTRCGDVCGRLFERVLARSTLNHAACRGTRPIEMWLSCRSGAIKVWLGSSLRSGRVLLACLKRGDGGCLNCVDHPAAAGRGTSRGG